VIASVNARDKGRS